MTKLISQLTAATPVAADSVEFETVGGLSRKCTIGQLGDGALIQEVVTSGLQASVTFSSIPATFRDLLIVVRGRMTGAVANEYVRLRFNADSGANYSYELFHAFSNTTVFTQQTGQTSAVGGQLTGASATASHAGYSRIFISDYRGTTFFKNWVAQWAATLGTGATTQGTGLQGGTWASASAITSVLVFPASGNFVNNSVVSLYGLN